MLKLSRLGRASRGTTAEQLAERHLVEAGLRIVERNYRCRAGEIDLIAESSDGELLVVEVRYRGSASHGGAAASVSRHKQQRIVQATRHYLAAHPQRFDQPLRFDVVALQGSLEHPQLSWIQDAFQL